MNNRELNKALTIQDIYFDKTCEFMPIDEIQLASKTTGALATMSLMLFASRLMQRFITAHTHDGYIPDLYYCLNLLPAASKGPTNYHWRQEDLIGVGYRLMYLFVQQEGLVTSYMGLKIADEEKMKHLIEIVESVETFMTIRDFLVAEHIQERKALRRKNRNYQRPNRGHDTIAAG